MSAAGSSRVFVTLLHEGTLAAELVCAGVTTLRKASTPRSGLFELALFNLSVGFERMCKLIVMIDHYLANKSSFPSNDVLKNKYGHDLDKLFPSVSRIVAERNMKADYSEPPSSEIHLEIIATLSEFAKTTRYYNLDYLTGGKAAHLQSGRAAWVNRVGKLILAKHYTVQKQIGDVLEAQELQASMGDAVSAIRFDEAGKSIDTLEEGLIHGAEGRVIQKFGQFYCLQLVRYLAAVLEELRRISHRDGFSDIPFFGEIFAWFLNDDAMLKSRKTWRIPE
jgi:hypothetical protein